jgi:signal transduction histidine kinase
MLDIPSGALQSLPTEYPDLATAQALLAVSLTALTVLRPLYGTGTAEPTDFTFDYLNPAGQRMLHLAARPAASFLTCFPHACENNLFAFYCDVFATGQPSRFEVNYQADGLDNYFYVAAQRQGNQLAVSFTDTASQARTAVETALRVSQTAETGARAEAESQREYFAEVLTELPAQVAAYHGPEHVFAFINPRYQQYFPGQDLLGRSLREVLPEIEEQGILDRLDQVYQTGTPYHAEAAEVWLDFARTGQRQQVYLDLFFHPLRDAKGSIYGVLDFSYDVTEQVRARQQVQVLAEQLHQLNEGLEQRIEARTLALRAHAEDARRARDDAEQQRASLVRFLSQTRAAICVLRGPAHVLDYANPTFERLIAGRSLPSGRPLAEVFPDAEALGLLPALASVYSTGTSFFGVEQELTVAPPTDPPTHPPCFTFSFDAYQEHGRTVGVSIFAYNVTEAVLARRQNEELQVELLAAAQRQVQERETFHQIFEETPALIALLRQPGHRVEYVNPAAQALFPGRSLVGSDLAVALPEIVEQGFVALLDGVYQTGEIYVGTELPLVVAPVAGPRLPALYYNFTCQAYREDGQIAGVSVFAYNVTEQVQARQQGQADARHALAMARTLTVTNQQLTRTNTDLDTFIYTASHDLRVPIANIEGLLTALREHLPAEALQADLVEPLLDRMQGSVERFQLTIAQLTDIAKLQQLDDQPAETVDLAALVADIRLDLEDGLALEGAALTVEVTTCPQVSFAPRNLRSIVYNLLSNALKYHAPDRPPVVALRCRSTEAAMVLEVEDNGLGLSASQQTQLFGLFRRLHDHVPGTGIGLYMVKRMVENAGGTIAVQSRLGEGTTFTITLPGSR